MRLLTHNRIAEVCNMMLLEIRTKNDHLRKVSKMVKQIAVAEDE